MKQSFSWSGAMLAGFGVLRSKPYVLLLWTLTGLVFGLIDQIIGTNAEILRSSGQGASWMVPMLGLARGVIAAVAMAVFSAAVYRAVLRPEGKAWGRMRFGADEIRLTLVWLLHGLLLLVVTIVAIVPALALSTLMAKQSPAITGVMGTIVAVGVLVAWIALIARLSLVAPMALAEGRWGGPAAWRLAPDAGPRLEDSGGPPSSPPGIGVALQPLANSVQSGRNGDPCRFLSQHAADQRFAG